MTGAAAVMGWHSNVWESFALGVWVRFKVTVIEEGLLVKGPIRCILISWG